MQDRKKLDFTYHPPRWPRYSVLCFALITLAAVCYTPLFLPVKLTLLLSICAVLLCYWRYLGKSPVRQVFCINRRWYVLLEDQQVKVPALLLDYARPVQGYLVLVFSARPYRQQKLTVYLARDNVTDAVFRAVCRNLTANSEIGR